MSLYQLSEPAVEPLTLAEVKKYLRVANSATGEDGLISSLITAARMDAENTAGGRVFASRDWVWTPDEPMKAGTKVNIPVSPAISVKSVINLADDTEVSEADYKFVASSLTPNGNPLFGYIMPLTEDWPEAVAITVTAGWPNTDVEADVVYKTPPAIQPQNTTYGQNSMDLQYNRKVSVNVPPEAFDVLFDDVHTSVMSVEEAEGRVRLLFAEDVPEGAKVIVSFVAGFIQDDNGNFAEPFINRVFPSVDFSRPKVDITDSGKVTETLSTVPNAIKTWMLCRIATLYQQRSEIAIQAGKTSNAFFPRGFINGLLDAYSIERA